HCLRLDIFPPKIDPGVTDSLLINCSLPSTKLSGMMTLSSLTLFKSFDNDSQLIELCSVSSNTGYKDHNAGDGTGNGVINSKDGSYLSLIWLFPNQHMIGHYKCQADGISRAWKKITVTSRASVSGHDMSVSNLSDQLRLVQLENVRNKNLIEQFIESITKHETILEEIKRRHYYLTKELVTFTATSAQATCQLYGGYLAEIDSSEELHCVKTFVNRYNKFNTVWISGSDEDIEGLWIHPRTKATIKYFNWPPSEPDGGRSQNCLCLPRSYNWLISSGGCIAQDLGLSLAYLCEVNEKMLIN
ncbi:cytochrome P450 2J3, partial [Biomphalaria glabrata]